MNPEIETGLRVLFETWGKEECLCIDPLGANGSNRQYFRMRGHTRHCVATYNPDVRENEAFVYYSRFFCRKGLRVPQVYALNEDKTLYLQEDLGDESLYMWLESHRDDPDKVRLMLNGVLDDLLDFQIKGRDAEFSHSYPRESFDRQSIQWDLNYFKYYYLKLAYVPFDEQLLENDFQKLEDYLLDEDCGYFLYRDFQSRNIMIKDGKCYYIDFQGGRKGAAQYDVASLLYSSKCNLPQSMRDDLVRYFIDRLAERRQVDKDAFESKFYGYVLVRILQALGAYGYRGHYERKHYFLNSIPKALSNIRYLLEYHPLPLQVEHLKEVLARASSSAQTKQVEKSGLVVEVMSFSYRKGLPEGSGGNGGGFVFDCRALHNPGRYDQFKMLTGQSREVELFFEKEPAVEAFLDQAQQLVDQSVKKYVERGFSNLLVSFGCTGGQHRSVYCAERMAAWLGEKHPEIQLVLVHREQHSWPQQMV